MKKLASHRLPKRSAVLLATVLVGLTAAAEPSMLPTARGGEIIAGPYASLLAASKNLGPSRADDVQLTVTLPAAAHPRQLMEWSHNRGLDVRWQAGQAWAIVTGPAERIAAAFDVPVRDFRGRQGQLFYASPAQPTLPSALRGHVTAVGRILSYLPHREARPMLPLDVPRPGLKPAELLMAYNATPLAEAGYTGQGQTVAVFAFGGFDQSDLDMFADTMELPRFTPEVVGGPLSGISAETVMDLQVVHAVAPDARLVVVNARPTVEGGGTFEKIGRMFDDVAQRYPRSVWTLSIGWGCEALVTAADVAPVRAALVKAHRRGITAFDASGDNAGLECKGGKDWSSPPGPAQVGVDTIASVPEITSVGGTTLSTDMQGRWLEEWGWIDPPLSQGSSGGVSRLFPRPDYQSALPDFRGSQNRLVPDVSAVADPFTGVQIVVGQNLSIGGGTSQSAPIWAGMTALMNQYIIDNGGRAIGDINPLLYRIAQGSKLPGFRDITAGGNAIDTPAEGYDLVTGLGSPNVDNLARNLLDAQTAQLEASDYLANGG
jgi:kumamolisin